jgi:hypothetical protein
MVVGAEKYFFRLLYTMHRDEIDELTGQTWTRIVANCIIWLTILGMILSRFDVLDIHSTLMGLCLGLSILAIAFLATKRSTMLPFLGESVLPSSLLKTDGHSPLADIVIDIDPDPRATHVAYWAADRPLSVDGAALQFPNPRAAYGKFTNSGIVKIEDGSATIKIQCPGRYAVRGKLLPKHVHYREVFPSGIMGAVKKVNVICN